MAGGFHDPGFLVLGAIALVYRRIEIKHFQFGLYIRDVTNANDYLAATFDNGIDCLVEGK